MNRFVAVLFAAVLVTLVIASIASAQRSAPTVRLALHHHHLLV